MTQPSPAPPAPAQTLPPSPTDGPRLARNMGLFALVVYGVGDMVGAGIYGTVGKAAGQMGNAVWLSFIVSMVAAMLTGLSYASISSRYPRAAGAAYVTHRAFHVAFLSYVIGLAVCASGLTSMATSTGVFSRTLAGLLGLTERFGHLRWQVGDTLLVNVPVATGVVILLFLAFLTFVNFWGIRESMWTNLLCTAVEVGGLVFIVAVGMKFWGSVNYLETPRATYDAAGAMTSTGIGPLMLFSGAVLTFFAFVGFEDMLNVAEEVKQPERTMPWGIVIAVIVTTVLYLTVAITTVSVVDYRELARVNAPFSPIAQRAAPYLPAWTFDAITMFAVANTVLINYIMGSRLLYGMARQGLLPAALGRVHAGRRTPHVAILTLLVLVSVLAFSAGVSELAGATGLLLLFCFMIVNGALIVLKLRPGEARGRFEVPLVVPALGIVVNATLIVSRVAEEFRARAAAAAAAATRPDVEPPGLSAPIIAGLLVLGIAILFFVMRPKTITEEALAEVEHDA